MKLKLPQNKHARRFLGRITAALLLLPALFLLSYILNHGARAIPPAFDPPITLAQATADAAGRPVLVFGTANWCPPCRALKRGALADERVTEWIKANTRPVYLDVDKSKQEARDLGVTSIPTLILVLDGRVIDRIEGVVRPDALLEWLQRPR